MNREEYTGATQRLVPPTEYLKPLDDPVLWNKREESAKSILRIVFIAVFVFMFAVLIITLTILGAVSLIIESGMRWYVSIAPFALLVIIGYLYGLKRRE